MLSSRPASGFCHVPSGSHCLHSESTKKAARGTRTCLVSDGRWQRGCDPRGPHSCPGSGTRVAHTAADRACWLCRPHWPLVLVGEARVPSLVAHVAWPSVASHSMASADGVARLDTKPWWRLGRHRVVRQQGSVRAGS